MGRRAIYGLRAVKDVKSARRWLGWSLSQTATNLGASRGLVVDWQSGRREMPLEKAQLLGKFMVDRLAQITGRDDIGLVIRANSPMHISIMARCAECREWFELTHAGHRRCEQCRGKS